MSTKVSVAMATYNGEKHIEEQLKTILNQLGSEDEMIVSDDGSTDKTLEIVRSFKDKRIKVFDGPKNGVKQNFGNAISKCSGKYIFLADQDDIWLDNKVAVVLETFRKERCTCVVHDAEVFDSKTGKTLYKSFFRWRGSRKGIWKNIWKNSYIGCCMAFTSDMKKRFLPIPDDVEMHDQWIGIICEKFGKSVFLPEVLLRYRRHDGNQTDMKPYKIRKMIANRFFLVFEYYRKGGRK